MVTATVRPWGNSQGIILPRNVLKMADIALQDTLEISVQEDGILLRKSKRPASLRDLFAGYKGDYRPAEFDTGEPVGREVFD